MANIASSLYTSLKAALAEYAKPNKMQAKLNAMALALFIFLLQILDGQITEFLGHERNHH